jgi:hypothetical protein
MNFSEHPTLVGLDIPWIILCILPLHGTFTVLCKVNNFHQKQIYGFLLRKNTNIFPHVGAYSERNLRLSPARRAHQWRPNRKAFHSFECTFYRSEPL